MVESALCAASISALGCGVWGQALEVSGRVWRGDSGAVAYGAAGISPAAMWRMRRASGQAAAKASRTREGTTRQWQWCVLIQPKQGVSAPQRSQLVVSTASCPIRRAIAVA